jgi:cell division protein FtsA
LIFQPLELYDISMRLSTDLYVIDCGTTKFCLASLIRDKAGSLALRTIAVPAGGMRRGMLADFDGARISLTNLLDQAERQLDRDIRKVAVGIAGSHLRSIFTSVSANIDNGQVDNETLIALNSKADLALADERREVIHSVPISYRIDQREPVDNPLNFTGSMIYAEFFVVDADRSYIKDMVRLMNQCGLEVSRLYSEPFASASVTLLDHHKHLGVALLDIGGGTSDGVVFRLGKPCSVFTLNIAGSMMTADLSIGLNIPSQEAEMIKLHFGLEDHHSIECIDFDGRPRIVTSREVHQILGARILEFAEHLGKSLLPFKGCLGSGLVITGGGSQVRGLGQFLQKIFKIPVSVIDPTLAEKTGNLGLKWRDHPTPMKSSFATALGLLNLELSRVMQESEHHTHAKPRRYVNQFINWLKEFS